MKFAFVVVLCCVLNIVSLRAQQATITSQWGDILYIGYANWLTIASPNGNCATITATSDIGELIKVERCMYSFHASKPGIATFTLKQRVKGQEAVIGSNQFEVRLVSHPEARIGGKKSGRFPIAAFKVQTGVGIAQEGWIGKPRYVILGFNIKIFRGQSLVLSEHNESCYFSGACKSFLKQELKVGDKVIIENLRCTCPDCRIQALGDLTYIMT